MSLSSDTPANIGGWAIIIILVILALVGLVL